MSSQLNKGDLWHLAFRSLAELRTTYGFAASEAQTGFYHTLFGRDSLWVLLMLLETARLNGSLDFVSWVERATADVLGSLCELQGARVNDATEEQPGKIIHEFRDELDDRLRNMGLVFEAGRSYSGFDQTFLFVTAYYRFTHLFPRHPLADAAWPHVERALAWILDYADEDRDGLYEYRRRNPRNLLNQVWKDSFDSAVVTGADVPVAPIAWIEVQGYAFRALLDAADLHDRRGRATISSELRRRARVLRAAVDERFWVDEHRCYAMALTGEKSAVPMVSSNAGHVMWTGLVDPAREAVLVQRLSEPDMTTRYGLRTLSSASPFYAPYSYHRGTIWPFDNAVFVMGLRDRGYRREARRLANGVSAALTLLGSPLELYVVLDRDLFVAPRLATDEALTFRRVGQENRNHATSAAALLYFAAILAAGDEDDDRS